MRAALAVAAAVLLAGCAGGAGEERGQVLLHASFGPGYTQADVDEVCRILSCQGMETSAPPRIAGWFRTQAECERARERVLAVPHATAEPCGVTLSSAWWAFHGAFEAGYAPEDVKALCQAATARDECMLLEGDPPRFTFSYPTLEVCERVRAKAAAVPHATVGACSEGGAAP